MYFHDNLSKVSLDSAEKNTHNNSSKVNEHGKMLSLYSNAVFALTLKIISVDGVRSDFATTLKLM